MSQARAPGEDAAGAVQAALASLRRDGAWRIDPVRFHWLEALARRLPGQPEAVRVVLQDRLEAAVAAYAQRLAAARPAGGDPPGPPPRAAQAPAPASAPLAQLNRYIRSARPPNPAAAPGEEQRDELASVRLFRRAWSTSRSQQQVAQAALRKPANPGPLNSHALVLDALESMRELSPDYLRRFLSHVESLQWLDAAREQAAPPRPAPVGKGRPAKPAAPARRSRGTR